MILFKFKKNNGAYDGVLIAVITLFGFVLKDCSSHVVNRKLTCYKDQIN